jgi:hypothetical protein
LQLSFKLLSLNFNMTPKEKIKELEKTLAVLRKKSNCKNCDDDEFIYQLEQEIKRLKKL